MGTYVNPGNLAFRRICGPNYVDKTGLISLVNNRVGGADSLICISRPRRFGKSYAAKMLAAYYDCSCDSHSLFDDKRIADSESYEKHLNQYNVIYLEITSVASNARRKGISMREVPNMIVDAVRDEILQMHPEYPAHKNLTDLLIRSVEEPGGKQYCFIIDEWDTVIREAKEDEEAQRVFLDLLREWFKSGTFTPKVVAAAYMTGILPIKKDGSRPAISEFDEYSMLAPVEFAEYVGFTDNEVRALCEESCVDYKDIKAWYDGYDFNPIGAVYNPYSVMRALKTGRCKSYWKKTSASNALKSYIDSDYSGLQKKVVDLIAGEKIEIDVNTFSNDFETFNSADDVLTLLVHLGYLTYHEGEETVQIPNEEVRIEFRQFLSDMSLSTLWSTAIKRSQQILENTLIGNGDAVAAAISEIREEQYAPQYYNNEQALRSVIRFAYLAAFGVYLKAEELPSGKGIADVVFIPTSRSTLPPILIELKWDQTSGGAIEQIKQKNYTEILKPYAGAIRIVGINYSTKTQEHTCTIEIV